MFRFSYGGQCDLSGKPGSPAMKCRNLSFGYANMHSARVFDPSRKQQDNLVLDNVTLTVQSGERIALVGPNGAGKSTLLKLILGVEKPLSGNVEVFGHPASYCLHRVSVVPQSSSIDWRFPVTVRQVVMMGRHVHLGWFKRPRLDDYTAVDEALKAMEISHLANRLINTLSGGERQRVMIARTLAHDADLLLLDEPLNHVDIATQELIFHALERLTANGKAAIVSTHDLGVLTVHFSRAVFLDKGIIADGVPKEVLTPEIIARAYGFEFHKNYRDIF